MLSRPMLTVHEVADLLKVKESTVRTWIHDDSLRAVKFGRDWRVAQRDLELRGPGELLGTRQTGLPQYRIADLVRDGGLMPKVQRVATALQRDEPARAARIARRWLGDASNYGKV